MYTDFVDSYVSIEEIFSDSVLKCTTLSIETRFAAWVWQMVKDWKMDPVVL